MARTAEELMDHHIGSMMQLTKETDLGDALSDYSEKLVAITRLDGRTRMMGHDTLVSVMGGALSFAVRLGMDIEHAVEKLNIVYRKSTDNYITLVIALPPFSRFAAFTYMVEDGKAVYVSGYAKTPVRMPSLGVKEHPFPTNEQALALTDRHIAQLQARDAEALAADYADDAVILTNLCGRPLQGKEDVRRYCEGLVRQAEKEIGSLTDPSAKITVRQAAGELSCVGFENRAQKQCGVLTQRIRGRKIIFESFVLQEATAVI